MASETTTEITSGTINTSSIYKTHQQIKKIVTAYATMKKEAYNVTETIKLNWVGDGRDAFESQYELLMSKLDDFGEVLEEIYDALVDSEAEYETVDDELRQEYVKNIS